MKTKNLILPIALVVCCLIIGGSFLLVQIGKQNSIEEQQLMQLKVEALMEEIANKQAECESFSAGLVDRWNNIIGVYYNETWDACYVKYFDEEGKVGDSSLDNMEDN